MMNYLTIRPPIDSELYFRLIEKAREYRSAKIDGVVLANLFVLCYECGLKKGELIALSIERGGV